MHEPARMLRALEGIGAGKVRWRAAANVYVIAKGADFLVRDVDWACGWGLAVHAEHGRGYRVELTTLGGRWVEWLRERVRGEGEAPVAAAPVPSAPVVRRIPVVRRAEQIARLRVVLERAESEVAVLGEMLGDVLGVVDTAGWESIDAAKRAEDAAAGRWLAARKREIQARYAIEQIERDAASIAVGMEGARASVARLDAGVEGVRAGRGAWLSVNGNSMITFPVAWERWDNPNREKDVAYIDLLGAAIEASDDGKPLTTRHLPSQKKTGRDLDSGIRAGFAATSRPLVQPWKAPAAREVSTETTAGWDVHDQVISETEAAPGVWLPMAAVGLADTAISNGWTVAMERSADGRRVAVRIAGAPARQGRAGGEMLAVWIDGAYDAHASGSWKHDGTPVVNGERLWAPKRGKYQPPSILRTAQAQGIAGTLGIRVPGAQSAHAPAGVSNPGGLDAWEGEGGACDLEVEEITNRGIETVAAPPRLRFVGTPVRLALPAAPVRLALTAGPVGVDLKQWKANDRAETILPKLGWCQPFVDAVRLAERGLLVAEDGGTFRTVGAVGRRGKIVKAERIRLLIGAGYLVIASSTMVEATDDAREVLAMIELNPGALVPEKDVMAAV
ncbi:hypothetical protein AB0O47_39995, partial [Streptomyces noursei]